MTSVSARLSCIVAGIIESRRDNDGRTVGGRCSFGLTAAKHDTVVQTFQPFSFSPNYSDNSWGLSFTAERQIVSECVGS